jgi:hypothetical protein
MISLDLHLAAQATVVDSGALLHSSGIYLAPDLSDQRSEHFASDILRC